MRILDVVFKAVERAEELADRARGVKRRKLGVVPEPPPVPDPFVARPAVTAAPEPPIADPARPAQVYGKRGCMWTARTVRRLQDRDVEYEFIDLEDPAKLGLEPRLIRETKQPEGPYVFLRGEFIGGYNGLDEIDRLGQLELRTMTAEERARAEEGRIKIAIPQRPPETRPPGEK